MEEISIVQSGLERFSEERALIGLINTYLKDENRKELDEKLSGQLIRGLKNKPGTYIFFARTGKEYVGLSICFAGFSTFNARPLLNVHDLVVSPLYRRKGIGKELMKAVISKARSLECCRVTLEVREDNLHAQHLYKKMGFGECPVPMNFWIREIL